MAGTIAPNINVSAMLDSLGKMKIRDSKYEEGAANLEGSLYVASELDILDFFHGKDATNFQADPEDFPRWFIKDAADREVTIGGKDYYLKDDGTWTDGNGPPVMFVMTEVGLTVVEPLS